MNKKIDKIKENIKKNMYKVKYQSKCKKLDISNDILEGLLERLHIKEVNDILDIISKSNNKEEFKNLIVEYIKSNKHSHIINQFLFGNITGNYSLFDTNYYEISDYNLDNFKDKDYNNTIKILRDNFYNYLLNNNEYKNKFLIDKDNNYNYTLDLDKELSLNIFDNCLNGIDTDNIKYRMYCYPIIKEYIISTTGIYGRKIIENNFDFIMYDLNSKKDLPLEERMKKYLERKELTDSEKNKLDNTDNLISKLKGINNDKAKELLERINNNENIEDIYFEYELLFREDIVSHLYRPNEEITLVEDYKDMRPQLIHMFIRDSEKFRQDIEDRIIKEIISNRKDKNTNEKLTYEEQKEFNKRMGLANNMLNPAMVNYTYDGTEFVYSDVNGFDTYHSDTSNQISASLYSEEYYYRPWYMGIGFNSDNIVPEAIVISSPSYLTTNKGFNNLEYNNTNEFNLTSASYQELIKNDGKSEIILSRSGMDYDTKASYVFLTVDSSNPKKSEELITKAKALADKSDLKLVIYDLYKIKKSYEETLKQNEDKSKHR